MSGLKESECGCWSKRTVSWSWCDKLANGTRRRCCRLSKKKRVLAQAQGVGVQVQPAAAGVDMKLWGETLHVIVIVIVIAEVSFV